MRVLTTSESAGKQFTILISLGPGGSGVAPALRATEICSALEQRSLAHHPLLWHLPSAELSNELAAALEERFERFADQVIPMGLTGAPNVALHVTEISGEIDWALTNLWHTGANDVLRVETPLVVPAGPDFNRRDALTTYGACSVPVGMAGIAIDGPWISIVPNGDGTAGRALPVLDATAVPEPDRQSLLREIRRRQRAAKSVTRDARPVVVRCRVDHGDDCDRLYAVLAAAAAAQSGRTAWRVGPLDLGPAGGPAPELLASDSSPIPPAVAAATTDLRRRRDSKINTRRVLEHLSGPAVASAATRDARAPQAGRRDFIASMMGQASIPGASSTAHFDGGRFCGLHDEEAEPSKLKPATSYITTADGRRREETVVSCFSFETEISRGLRSESTVVDSDSGARARIRIEYSFVGEHDALVATQHVLVEGGGDDDSLTVLAVPVAHPERCAVTGRYRDGSTYDFDVQWKLPEIVLWAEVFQVWDGESCVTVAPLTSTGHATPWTLSVCGRPDPVIAVGGRYRFGTTTEHHISFLMVRGALDHALIERVLAGRLPHAIADEIAAGTEAELSIQRSGRRAPREA